MKHTYVIIDDNPRHVQDTKAVANGFPNLQYLGSASNYDDALDLILQTQPELVFLEASPENAVSGISLSIADALLRYLHKQPKFVVVSKDGAQALSAIRHEALDYCVKPMRAADLRRTIMRYEKMLGEFSTVPSVVKPAQEFDIPAPVNNQPLQEPVIATVIDELPEVEEQSVVSTERESAQPIFNDVPVQSQANVVPTAKPLTIGVKSYGDYRFVDARDIQYLQADNNSTDIHLKNGETVTAFKTLKAFELALPKPFVRIHNSYIVNMDFVSRIHTGNSVCYIKDSNLKLPFSKSYKENVDSILNAISDGNYLEI